MRIKFLSALRSYTLQNYVTFQQFVTFHNFVTQKFLMTLPYRRIYVKRDIAACADTPTSVRPVRA
jgi:hypothetical protein